MPALAYGYEKQLPNATFPEALAQVTAALNREGFGVLTEIDVRETLKKKLDVDFRHYVILGACNPPLAHRAITAEAQIGLLLPCNVVVQDAPGGGVTVSIADPKAMLTLVANPDVKALAEDVDARVKRVLAALG